MESISADPMAGEVVLVGTAKARPFRNVWMLEAAGSFDTVLTLSWLTTMDHIWCTFNHSCMRAVLSDAFSISQSRCNVLKNWHILIHFDTFWRFVYVSSFRLLPLRSHILRILEPREELHIPYTLLPVMPRSSDVLTLNPAGKVPILKAGRLCEKNEQLMINYDGRMLATSLMSFFVLIFFFTRPGIFTNWKRSQL